MDLDAYVTAHAAEWEELDELLRVRRLSAAQGDRLLELYARVGTHLSVIRAAAPDPELVGRLSMLLSRTRTRFAPEAAGLPQRLKNFFARDFPATLWRMRWWALGSTVANVVLMFVLGWWFWANPSVESSLMTPEEIRRLTEVDFAQYYRESAATDFALRVWTNNAWIAAQCIVLGVLGLPVLYVCWQNCLNVAIVGSIMVRHDRAGLFFGLILPHGLLELTAVFVAAGVGLRLCWAWIAPGDRTRSASLAREGRAAMTAVLGLAVVLFLSGLIEAFVTPSGLPTWARIGIGVAAEIAFIAYVVGLGRPAVLRGADGDLESELDRGYAELTRA